MKRTIIAGALGNCVHVAGVVGFLRIAERLGYETEFLGAAVSAEDFVEAVKRHDPEIVGISYRLTPEVGKHLVADLVEKLEAEGLVSGRRFVFGGTPPVCEAVEKLGFFERLFTGLENQDAVWSFLKSEPTDAPVGNQDSGSTLLERLDRKSPYPLLRHHFGLPNLQDTIDGVRAIAESGVLDVISIAPDQNAQESFFRPEEMAPELDGAGGVPLRRPADLRAIYEASRRGNYPLLRIYSGTRDLLRWAEVAVDTIHNAWAAVPLCWYSVLDGRSKRPLEQAIEENQECMRWYGMHHIPVEVNEPHHWSLRDAHDVISIVMAYLAAYNAKAMGVRVYVAQYMLNTPPGIGGKADLAKLLAQIELVESLHGPEFLSLRQVRAGLLHLSPRMMRAKGQLAASTMLALAVMPHIIHVVGYCEGDHAALPDEVIESCEIVHGVLRNCFSGMPDMISDPAVQERKAELLSEAEVLLNAIRALGEGENSFISPRVLARAISCGILDAPHLKGNAAAAGRLVTQLTDKGVCAVDPANGRILTERERLEALASTYRETPLERMS